ncbi:hypothetical protein ACTG9Q_02350 [Actinokineospora sp. 24-640]
MFGTPTVVVTRRVFLHALTDETTIDDGHGRLLADAVLVGAGGAGRAAARFLRGLNQFTTRGIEVRSPAGPLLALTREGSAGRLRMAVATPSGQPVGEVRQENTVGSLRLALTAGARVGELRAAGNRAWHSTITDHSGAEAAALTKVITGLGRTADGRAIDHTFRYELRFHHPPVGAFAPLALAAVFAVDEALRHIRPKPGG